MDASGDAALHAADGARERSNPRSRFRERLRVWSPIAVALAEWCEQRPRAAVAVSAAASCLALWVLVLEPGSLSVNRYRVRIAGWNSHGRPLRVALIGDLHVGSPFNGISKLERVVTATNEARPDLILLAGDYVIHGVLGGRFVPPEETAGYLRRLQAPLGVYGVLGNHDWWLDGRRVAGALRAAGVVLLEDDAVKIPRVGDADLWLVGISDHWEGAHDVRKALRKVPPNSRILAFTHNPDVFPQVPRSVGLTLAAHTHGGQVWLPLIGPPIVPSRYGQRYARGLVVEDGKLMFVTVGIGTSILPIRFCVPPEIAILDLS